jgi:pimeloyl-ACP methyl ester carboxylesterase
VSLRTISLAGAAIELFDGGAGRGEAPILYLHAGRGFRPAAPYVAMLAARRRLIAPSHPGFGRSELPDWLDHIDDIAYLYLELVERLGLDRVDLVGASIGGWIAAEIAAKTPAWLNRLVLVGPCGVKLGPPDRLDIPDIFATAEADLHRLLHHDPEAMRVDPATLSDEELTIAVRNRETLALLAWEPYLHNPKLRRRLHRVRVPTLFVRGAGDGLISAEYVAGYAALFAHARVATIAAAGHLPQLEQPAAFCDTVLGFLAEGAP